MILAAECFKDTLIDAGLDEDSAEIARKALLTLKKTTVEETQNKILKIASKLSFIGSNSQSEENHFTLSCQSLENSKSVTPAPIVEESKEPSFFDSVEQDIKLPSTKYNLADILPLVPDPSY